MFRSPGLSEYYRFVYLFFIIIILINNLQISKEEIDLLGTQEMTLQGPPETPDTQVYPDIPMCMISLYCDEDITTRLRYGVPVEGINEKKTIFIMRHAETLPNTQGMIDVIVTLL